MKALDLLNLYRKKLDSDALDDKYSALMFALQLPGICGRIEFEQTDENTDNNEKRNNGTDISLRLYKKNGMPLDGNIYQYWLRKHRFLDMSKAIYDLRCCLTHEGFVKTSQSKIVLVDSDGIGSDLGSVVCISICVLCRSIFDEAAKVFKDHHVDFSDFTGCGLDYSVFSKLDADVWYLYSDFWKGYEERDRKLNMIYDFVFSDDDLMLNKVHLYFSENPNGVFEIHDFGRRYSIVPIDDELFSREFDAYGFPCILCRFNNVDFIRMLDIRKALCEYDVKCVKPIISKSLDHKEVPKNETDADESQNP